MTRSVAEPCDQAAGVPMAGDTLDVAAPEAPARPAPTAFRPVPEMLGEFGAPAARLAAALAGAGQAMPFFRARGPAPLAARRFPAVLKHKPYDPDAPMLGRLGSLEVRLARSKQEVKRAQSIRYKVFYEEMSAIADPVTLATRRDADAFDDICDHLLVIDHEPEARRFQRRKPKVVGTYRLLRREIADLHGGFYSASEFDLSPLTGRRPKLRMLELGRSCVLAPYRSKRTLELLWSGNWAYTVQHGCELMVGCASFEGTDADRFALPLSFLHHHCLAAPDMRPAALPGRRVEMNRLPAEAVDTRGALHALPPLIKGYLRLGARIGDGAVLDRQFGTIDVLIVLPVSDINTRYINYYGADASRHAV